MNSMLSILTNFGCHFSCKYCVYRENGINIPFTSIETFGWNELEEELKNHVGKLVSISGGGDPLYNYSKKENKEFYKRLFSLLNKYNCKLELHTSIFDINFPYSLCERVVFHFTVPNQIAMLNALANQVYLEKSIVRVVYVVQDHYSKHLVNEIVKEVKASPYITELSFRQMIDSRGNATYTLHNYLVQGHKKDWYYIEQCDYNEYFVQNHIEREYLNIK